MTAPMLAAHSLGFGYGGKVIGRDVDLEVRPGEVVCLLGPNGSGKTTLFKTLLGLLPALAGEVRLDGRPIAELAGPRSRAASPTCRRRMPLTFRSASSTWSSWGARRTCLCLPRHRGRIA